MKLGKVFEQPSNDEFVAMLDSEQSGERLLFSYLELDPDGGIPDSDQHRIIARVKKIHKENPLLSRDQAGVSASVDMELPTGYSQRFTYGWVKCAVVGEMTPGGYLDMNRRVVPPNAEVHTPSVDTIQSLFFNSDPSHLPIGTIDMFGDKSIEEIPVTVNGDTMATKHFCVFGMTGTGKTNTAARLMEEYLSRGQKVIIFDPHDDYTNLDNYINLFRDKEDNKDIRYSAPIEYSNIVQEVQREIDVRANPGQSEGEAALERTLRTASVIHENIPARSFLGREGSSPKQEVSEEIVEAISESDSLRALIQNPGVREGSAFPELRNYESTGFTINLLQAFYGKEFTAAGRDWLSDNIDQAGAGIDYLQNIDDAAGRRAHGADTWVDNMISRVRDGIDAIEAAYREALQAGAHPFDLANLAESVVDREECREEPVFRLSLSDLSAKLRKVTVYGIVEYLFRRFKYGEYRVRGNEDGPANALPTLFVLEEARSLIPNTSSESDDVAGNLARSAMRRIAYEGRKFSLGFGLVSQKPSTVDQEVASQANTFILHQLKSPDDQQYVRKVTESMAEEELDMIPSLGTGRAVVSGLAVQSPVLLDVSFRHSEEGVEAPTPIQDTIGEAVMNARDRLGNSED